MTQPLYCHARLPITDDVLDVLIEHKQEFPSPKIATILNAILGAMEDDFSAPILQRLDQIIQ